MKDGAAVFRQALELLQAQRGAEAEPLIDQLLADAPDDPNALFFKGGARLLQNDAKGAIGLLEAASARAPGQPMIESARGRALLKLGRHAEAKAAFELALAANPNFGEARFMLGEAFEHLHDRPRAIEAFERAAQDPAQRARALAKLGTLFEALGRIDEARAAARDAVAAAPDNVEALTVWSRLTLDEGDAETVITRIEMFLATQTASPIDRAVLSGIVADAHDKLGACERAFAAYQAANDELQAHYADEFGGGSQPYALSRLHQMHASLSAAPDDLFAPLCDGPPGPVFLVGFPRSGTTLLDQILSGHSQIEVVEETENLNEAIGALAAEPARLAETLAALTEDEASRLRAAYEASFRARLAAPDRAVAVDKYPLLLNWTPIIRRLWPNARFILAVRDPRDAVWSAFQQRFGMNPAMFAMLKLDTAAAYYDAAMGLFHTLEEKAALRVHRIRYEDVLDDLDGAIGGLIAFLGLEWEDRVRDHRATASGRRIATPSARQVIKPLYRSSVAKWRRYEAQMAPVRDLLDPWAERFGYDAE